VIIAPSTVHVVAYGAATGAPLWNSPPLEDFPHGKAQVNVTDIDGDGRDEVVVASDNAGARFPAAKRLMVLELEGDELLLRTKGTAATLRPMGINGRPPVTKGLIE